MLYCSRCGVALGTTPLHVSELKMCVHQIAKITNYLKTPPQQVRLQTLERSQDGIALLVDGGPIGLRALELSADKTQPAVRRGVYSTGPPSA